MSRIARFTTFVALIFGATACRVETSSFVEDAYVRPAIDGGRDEDAPDCRSTCTKSGHYCTEDGECVPRPTTCARTSDCVPDEVCTLEPAAPPDPDGGISDGPLGATELATDAQTKADANASPDGSVRGRCVVPPRSCTNGCAATELCTPSGYCVPARDESLAVRCATAGECGPAGACAMGACEGCATGCPARLTCEQDRCSEQRPCLDDNGCFEGNTCFQPGVGGTCARRSACAPNANGGLATASPLDEGLLEAEICGNESDWYRLVLPAKSGGRVVLTSSASRFFLEAAAVTDDKSTPVAHAGTLNLPGITIVEVSALSVDQTVYLKVWGRGVSTPYSIDSRYVRFLCAGDELDIQGDTSTAAAVPIFSNDFSRNARVCLEDEDRLDVQLRAQETFTATASVTLPDNGTELELSIETSTGAVVATATGAAPRVSSRPFDRDVVLHVISRPTHVPPAGAGYRLDVRRRSN